jgi:hypothetical protein
MLDVRIQYISDNNNIIYRTVLCLFENQKSALTTTTYSLLTTRTYIKTLLSADD